jgi:hypothetical protein
VAARRRRRTSREMARRGRRHTPPPGARCSSSAQLAMLRAVRRLRPDLVREARPTARSIRTSTVAARIDGTRTRRRHAEPPHRRPRVPDPASRPVDSDAPQTAAGVRSGLTPSRQRRPTDGRGCQIRPHAQSTATPHGRLQVPDPASRPVDGEAPRTNAALPPSPRPCPRGPGTEDGRATEPSPRCRPPHRFEQRRDLTRRPGTQPDPGARRPGPAARDATRPGCTPPRPGGPGRNQARLHAAPARRPGTQRDPAAGATPWRRPRWDRWRG